MQTRKTGTMSAKRPPAVRIETSSSPARTSVGRLLFSALLPGRCGDLALAGGALIAAHHRIVRESPDGEWRTDEDEFGVLVVDPRKPGARVVLLPVPFRAQHCGSDASRDFDLAAIVGDTAVFTVTSPYSDKGGWGNRDFLFGFDLKSRRWSRLEVREDGRIASRVIPARATEKTLRPFGGGELVVWKDADGGLHAAEDWTPYHLEDSEISPETRVELDARNATRKLLEQGRLPTRGPDDKKTPRGGFYLRELPEVVLSRHAKLRQLTLRNTFFTSAIHAGEAQAIVAVARSWHEGGMSDVVLVFEAPAEKPKTPPQARAAGRARIRRR